MGMLDAPQLYAKGWQERAGLDKDVRRNALHAVDILFRVGKLWEGQGMKDKGMEMFARLFEDPSSEIKIKSLKLFAQLAPHGDVKALEKVRACFLDEDEDVGLVAVDVFELM